VPIENDAARHKPAWIAEIGIDRPVVHVTFGTEMSHLAPWTVLLTALAAVDADVVITTGGAALPEDPCWAPNLHIESYVPHSYFLDRVTVAVSHAGAGSMLAAAARGIPQLCLPLGADQWENATAIEATGAAITLRTDNVTTDAIHNALQTLLHTPTHASAARHVQADIAQMPHPAEHIAGLEQLIANT
jgi:UDP:flavonoid glycosyltransferase YjiC (YdhE family)